MVDRRLPRLAVRRDHVQAWAVVDEVGRLLLDVPDALRLRVVREVGDVRARVFCGLLKIPAAVAVGLAKEAFGRCQLLNDVEEVPCVSLHARELQDAEFVLHNDGPRPPSHTPQPLQQAAMFARDASVGHSPVMAEAVHTKIPLEIEDPEAWQLATDVEETAVCDHDDMLGAVEEARDDFPRNSGEEHECTKAERRRGAAYQGVRQTWQLKRVTRQALPVDQQATGEERRDGDRHKKIGGQEQRWLLGPSGHDPLGIRVRLLILVVVIDTEELDGHDRLVLSFILSVLRQGILVVEELVPRRAVKV
mmetsp:Transcript_43344/g.125296  ORF Transcript_43344/g.125296 Transcript_43344/m.125296 type:complete len:306 (+) Transcript_43344:821-1738(+)